MSENIQSPEMNILERYVKSTEQIKDIQELGTGTIQISLERGRIWIDAELSMSKVGIRPFLSVRFIDDAVTIG